MDLTLIVVLVIALALFFDFTNGFHDTANAMATPIATGAMKPKVAVTLAAILNLVGAFLSTEVAKTISGGLIKEGAHGIQITPEMIFAGLVGAIIWNMVTWLFGLPSSSSHALFGGLIGAAIVGAGFQSVDYLVLLDKVIFPALLAPVIAGGVAFTATKIAYAITRRYDGLPDGRAGFRYGQIFSSSLVALAHGTNDAQKTMGVITLTLIAANLQPAGSDPTFWVIAACALAIAAGTYTGGWRIIHTLGKGLTEVKPAQGFAAETSTAAAILASSHLGFALSTTQVASGSVIGSGLGRRGSSVRWKTARRIALGWLMTLPAAAIVGAIAAWVAHLGAVGVGVDLVLAIGLIAAIFLVAARQRARSKKAQAAGTGVSDVARSGRVVKIRKVKPKRPPRPKKSEVSAKPKKKKKKGSGTKKSSGSKKNSGKKGGAA
ncbi:inorganic phosphate transporter [Leifsonia sp. Root112D2]|uniref:inorganic phosphate transporter n=1 Tax=Leifsonia sp. Root112D2 TaxID=1736426 RepID=UPI0006F8D81E|nr:inorganic phosphate transporter [Leifsonia sp. Root112D2]KQV05150.1 phosphate transporter [Leifsonia sp. Root112D2]